MVGRLPQVARGGCKIVNEGVSSVDALWRDGSGRDINSKSN